jgi:drug/metabolite transporter (DMT)-like permease
VLLFCGLNTLVAYGAFAEALEHWEASRVSAILTLTPAFTLASVWAASQVWPTLLAPERLSLGGLAGTLLVVGGSLALALARR